MTTRERIVDEALTLFSIKGFKGTSVKNIADAVGIKDSSLYKHFKSKREIFDTIVLKMRKRMECMTEQIGLPDEEKLEEAAKFYGRITLEDLQEFSRKAFLFYLKDEFILPILATGKYGAVSESGDIRDLQANIHGRKHCVPEAALQYDDTQWLFCKRGSANNGNHVSTRLSFFC